MTKQVRRRTCQNGNTCPGSGIKERECTRDVSCQAAPGSTKSLMTIRTTVKPFFLLLIAFCFIGYKKLGCYRYVAKVFSIEKRTSELQDYPPTRVDAVNKCAKAAQQLGYSLFAVSLGFCISGSSRRSDYQQFKASSNAICRNGKGGYSKGFYMDVYSIQDHQTASDSSTQQKQLDEQDDLELDFSGDELEEAEPDLEADQSAAYISSSSCTLLLLMLLTVFMMFV